MYYKSGKGPRGSGNKEDLEKKKKEQELAKADMLKKLNLPEGALQSLASAAKKKPKPVIDPTKPRKRQGF